MSIETINKDEFAKALSAKWNVSQKEAHKKLDEFFECIIEMVNKGMEIRLISYLTIKTIERAARSGINPKTKEPMHIDAKKVLKIIPGSKLSNAVPS